MANRASFFPLHTGGDLRLIPETSMNQSLWQSLKSNLGAAFFPEKLPPLHLTARPAPVREIWGAYRFRKRSAASTVVLHAIVIGGLIALSLWPFHQAARRPPQQVVDLIAPDISLYEPVAKLKEMGGGGGGGDHDKLEAPQGKMPKLAPQQITPPAIVIRNDDPKLAVEPTVVMPPTVKLAAANMPTIGVPNTRIAGPASNGIGSQGGVGSGAGDGLGSGIGSGVGPGEGGGFGGGIYRIGGGVLAPKVLYDPDPEYTEEARKAKYQGTCVLWLIVGPDGRPRGIRVARTLGMGLDQKAVQAVQQWRFQPATKDGKPVAVQLNVEVNFRLY